MSYLNDIKQHLESLQKREGSLAVAIRGLDAALAAHKAQMSPQLQHYLSQRSYDKALAWVSAELAAENAATGGAVGDEGIAGEGKPASSAAFTPPPGGCSGRRERN